MNRTIKFRAKLQDHSDDEWYYGLPALHFAEDVKRKEYAKWYLCNYELRVAEYTNYFHRTGEEYKSSYSAHIDISTLQICIDGGEWENCELPFMFTKKYKIYEQNN
jgi:hypothetical protein